MLFHFSGASCFLALSGATPLRLILDKSTSLRLAVMCHDESVSKASMIQEWVATRHDMAKSAPDDTSVGLRPVGHNEALQGDTLSSAASSAVATCIHTFNTNLLEDCLEVFGVARTEAECPEMFMRAVVRYGDHLLDTKGLNTYDIMHEVIRAETGYRIARLSGVDIDSQTFDAFMDFQSRLADTLQGWALWEYEFNHWIYHKRPHDQNEYVQTYNTHRLLEFQHLECPATPLVYRMWSNFPTCPPTRLRDLPRFNDAYISGMTVDNWRAGYRDFLSENYNYNTSMENGDPTHRLSKGAHSVFAGTFIQKLPNDMWCYQQVIHDLRPHYIIDLGTSQGGSAVWYASMLKLFEIPGKVITVDIGQEQAYWLNNERATKAANRMKVSHLIDWNYVSGGSKNEKVRKKIKRLCANSPCMVVSDSDHDYEHTYWELEWYAQVVGIGQYLVVEDTNVYGWNGWMNINDPNVDGLRRGPMEAANDFELSHKTDFQRTDWCTKHYGSSQTPNGWFYRRATATRGLHSR